jgi:hypothetical protein
MRLITRSRCQQSKASKTQQLHYARSLGKPGGPDVNSTGLRERERIRLMAVAVHQPVCFACNRRGGECWGAVRSLNYRMSWLVVGRTHPVFRSRGLAQLSGC